VNLLVISHTPHYLTAGAVAGWGPTVREIDHLARLFDRVVHVAPLHDSDPPASSLSYRSNKVSLRPVAPSGGDSAAAKLGVVANMPGYLRTMLDEMSRADVVQVRCPANISLLAIALLAVLRRPRHRWAKYAGSWAHGEARPWSYGLQRWWLQHGLHRGVVTVNGTWPGQPRHVYSFLNPSLSQEELVRRDLRKALGQPYRLLFVGYLDESKGAGRALQVAAILKQRGKTFHMEFVGDGPLRARLEAQVEVEKLRSNVSFLGWLPKPELPAHYARAHFFIFPSASEGWPKVLSEAMAFGAVPVAGAVSCIPQILIDTGAGTALPPLDVGAFADCIMDYIADEAKWRAASLAGMRTAERFTYDSYLENVRKMMREAWNLELPPPQNTEPPTND
jgi:glycosyltransferase involved in cell wall biosynthesis